MKGSEGHGVRLSGRPDQGSCRDRPGFVIRSQVDLFHATVRALGHVVEVDEAFLTVRDSGNGGFTVAATTAPGVFSVGAALDGLGSAVETALSGGRVVRLGDLELPAVGEGGRFLLGAGFRSLAIAPVLARGRVAGALVLVSRSSATFTRDHDGFVAAMGTQLALALGLNLDAGSVVSCSDAAGSRAACPRERDCPRNGAFIVAESTALRAVLARVDLVAPTNTSVLVLGESGTGKELVAQEIHRRSRRAGGPLVAVNCASVPRELFESEFFGHVKGAFTGAVRDRTGRFQEADGGTLFLDEVAEIPLDMQSKLLRVLQEGRCERVGESVSRRVDVRIVAATNRTLGAEVEKGRFRTDLYYRLDVFRIELPPLRDRPEAIEPLARSFLQRFSAELNLPCPGLDEAALRQMRSYHWPGNVRELQNVIERGVIMSGGGPLRLDLDGQPPRVADSPPQRPSGRPRVLTASEMRRFERDNLEAALQVSSGRVYGRGGAAEILGVPPSTLTDRLVRLGLTVRRGRQRPGGGHEDS